MLSWLPISSALANKDNATARDLPDQEILGLHTAAYPILSIESPSLVLQVERSPDGRHQPMNDAWYRHHTS
jgi:hypothetical protein